MSNLKVNFHKLSVFGTCLDIYLTLKCELDLNSSCANVSNGTHTDRAEQLFQIFSNSMHNYRSNSLDKLNFNI